MLLLFFLLVHSEFFLSEREMPPANALIKLSIDSFRHDLSPIGIIFPKTDSPY